MRGYLSCTPPGAPGYAHGAVTLLYINSNPESNASFLMYQQDRLSMMVNLNRVSYDNDGGFGSNDAHPAASNSNADSPWGPTPPPFNLLPRMDFVMTPSDPTGMGLLSRDVLCGLWFF